MKTIKYYSYLIIHKIMVIKEIMNIVFLLFIRALLHDNSKFRPEEARGFIKIIDNQKEGKEYFDVLSLIAKEVNNHYKNNRHHPQHYKNGIDDMGLIDIIEMLCDWKASNQQRHNFGTIELSIGINKNRFNISDQLTKILLNTTKEN